MHAVELHRRFEHRGEFYRIFLEEVRDVGVATAAVIA